MNNPEPLLEIKTKQEISLKKTFTKIKEFLNSNNRGLGGLGGGGSEERSKDDKQTIRVGKVSDELLEKLQIINETIENQINFNEKKKKKHKVIIEQTQQQQEEQQEEEELKPKKKKSRKSSN